MKHQDRIRREEIIIRDGETADLLKHLKANLPIKMFDQVQDKLNNRQTATIRNTTYDLNHGIGRVGYLTALVNTVSNHLAILNLVDSFTYVSDKVVLYHDGTKTENRAINSTILEHLAKINGWTEIQFRWWKEVPK